MQSSSEYQSLGQSENEILVPHRKNANNNKKTIIGFIITVILLTTIIAYFIINSNHHSNQNNKSLNIESTVSSSNVKEMESKVHHDDKSIKPNYQNAKTTGLRASELMNNKIKNLNENERNIHPMKANQYSTNNEKREKIFEFDKKNGMMNNKKSSSQEHVLSRSANRQKVFDRFREDEQSIKSADSSHHGGGSKAKNVKSAGGQDEPNKKQMNGGDEGLRKHALQFAGPGLDNDRIKTDEQKMKPLENVVNKKNGKKS